MGGRAPPAAAPAGEPTGTAAPPWRPPPVALPLEREAAEGLPAATEAEGTAAEDEHPSLEGAAGGWWPGRKSPMGMELRTRSVGRGLRWPAGWQGRWREAAAAERGGERGAN